jgi:hypothetical protein
MTSSGAFCGDTWRYEREESARDVMQLSRSGESALS